MFRGILWMPNYTCKPGRCYIDIERLSDVHLQMINAKDHWINIRQGRLIPRFHECPIGMTRILHTADPFALTILLSGIWYYHSSSFIGCFFMGNSKTLAQIRWKVASTEFPNGTFTWCINLRSNRTSKLSRSTRTKFRRLYDPSTCRINVSMYRRRIFLVCGFQVSKERTM